MTTSAAAPTQQKQGGKHQRSIKNYLLDAKFQLKYTSYIVGVTLFVSGILGAVLWSTSGDLVAQSQRVVEESRKVSEVVRMNMKDDPIYKDNPELGKAFNDEAAASEQKLQATQQALIDKQRTMLMSLVGGLALLVVLIGLLGIYYTHKVAGPIYKMKLLLRQVGDGKLNFQGRLRKGDELQHFFETFHETVEKLKARQANEIRILEAAMEEARKGGAGDASLSKIALVRDEMKAALDL